MADYLTPQQRLRIANGGYEEWEQVAREIYDQGYADSLDDSISFARENDSRING